MQKRGKFITFEGCEGAGKSTQAKMLCEYLASKGIDAVLTREVGGTESAEKIRECWLSKKEGFWEPMTEVLLIMAARNEHIQKKILPALNEGKWVICDRFLDSTIAYQGAGLGIDIDIINKIYDIISCGLKPDLTILLDIQVNNGLMRVSERDGIGDRYEQQDFEFHEILKIAYLTMAEEEPERFLVVDAAKDKEEIIKKIIERISV